MRVTIIGPNLNANAQRLGYFHVHAEGCTDIRRDPKRYGYGNEPAWTIEVATRDEVGDAIYEDMIAEGSMQPGDGTDDCHFAPCVRELS